MQASRPKTLTIIRSIIFDLDSVGVMFNPLHLADTSSLERSNKAAAISFGSFCSVFIPLISPHSARLSALRACSIVPTPQRGPVRSCGPWPSLSRLSRRDVQVLGLRDSLLISHSSTDNIRNCLRICNKLFVTPASGLAGSASLRLQVTYGDQAHCASECGVLSTASGL